MSSRSVAGRQVVGGWVIAALLGVGCTSKVVIDEALEGDGAGETPSGAESPRPVAGPSEQAGPWTAVIDAATDHAAWKRASDTEIECFEHTATPIGNGRALIVGACWRADTAEEVSALRYDLATRTFESLVMEEPRRFHEAARGEDGRIVVAGDAQRLEVFDPATGLFHPGPLLLEARSQPGLVVLPDGRAWVIGGFDDSGASLATTEVVDLDAGESSEGPPLITPRGGATAVMLPDGSTLVVGGEVVDPYETTDPPMQLEHSACATCPFQSAGDFDVGGNAVTAVSAPDGVALIAGFESAWWLGGATTRPIDHETTAYFPRATLTSSGRVLAAGVAGYEAVTRILEISPGEPGRLVGTRQTAGVVTSLTALTGDTVLVLGPDARLFTPE